MAVCLDTTVLVDLLAGDSAAVAFADALTEPVAVSAVSFYELLYGGVGRRRLSQVEAMARDYVVLPADFEVCSMAASIQARLGEVGQLIAVLDAIIAGTAVLAGVPLVTMDEHFRRVPPDFGLALRAY